MDILDVPFNRLLGLRHAQYEGAPCLCLDPAEQHCNHLGTIHAAVLYALAEAASGQLLIEMFRSARQPLAVVRRATVKYRRPATGTVFAMSSLSPESSQATQEQLSKKKRSLTEIDVRIVDTEGLELLVGQFHWFLSTSD